MALPRVGDDLQQPKNNLCARETVLRVYFSQVMKLR